ncbi:ABC transporter permease, partial [Bacillus tequilensis]|nr:ABC transporter permease [Bacillus tequilensis]
LLVLLVEIVVVAAMGVGLSGLIARPLFSIAATYLVVAALVIGTVIAFGLGGAAIRTEVTQYERGWDVSGEPICDSWEEYTYEQPRFDYVWGFLAANPFVVMADATPTEFVDGYPQDVFGQLKYGVRVAQLPPGPQRWDVCDGGNAMPPTPEEQMHGTVPSWFVGLGIQLVIAGGLFAGAWSRTRTPARRLPPGTRIA